MKETLNNKIPNSQTTALVTVENPNVPLTSKTPNGADVAKIIQALIFTRKKPTASEIIQTKPNNPLHINTGINKTEMGSCNATHYRYSEEYKRDVRCGTCCVLHVEGSTSHICGSCGAGF